MFENISPPRTKWQPTAAKGLVWNSYITKVSFCKVFFDLYLVGKRFVSFSNFEVKQTVQLKRCFPMENLQDFETMLSKVWAINVPGRHIAN